MFREEMEAAKIRIAELIAKNNRPVPVGAVRSAMEAAQRKRSGTNLEKNST